MVFLPLTVGSGIGEVKGSVGWTLVGPSPGVIFGESLPPREAFLYENLELCTFILKQKTPHVPARCLVMRRPFAAT